MKNVKSFFLASTVVMALVLSYPMTRAQTPEPPLTNADVQQLIDWCNTEPVWAKVFQEPAGMTRDLYCVFLATGGGNILASFVQLFDAERQLAANQTAIIANQTAILADVAALQNWKTTIQAEVVDLQNRMAALEAVVDPATVARLTALEQKVVNASVALQ